MTELQKELESMKAQAEFQAKNYATGKADVGILTNATSEPCRPSLAERVRLDLNRARQESVKASRLEELNMLLSKHPDVARILDLLEDVRR